MFWTIDSSFTTLDMHPPSQDPEPKAGSPNDGTIIPELPGAAIRDKLEGLVGLGHPRHRRLSAAAARLIILGIVSTLDDDLDT